MPAPSSPFHWGHTDTMSPLQSIPWPTQPGLIGIRAAVGTANACLAPCQASRSLRWLPCAWARRAGWLNSQMCQAPASPPLQSVEAMCSQPLWDGPACGLPSARSKLSPCKACAQVRIFPREPGSKAQESPTSWEWGRAQKDCRPGTPQMWVGGSQGDLMPLKSSRHVPCVYRTVYSAICAELASRGFLVAALEHR